MPNRKRAVYQEPIAPLNEMGSLEEVLGSPVSLEMKKACIELAIHARDRKRDNDAG